MTLATNIQLVIDSGNQINEAFPIAGQDNNTQGFRDNFNKTQAGLVAAGNSLQELNTKTPKLDGTSNDYDDVGTVVNAILENNKGKTKTVTMNGDLTLTISDAEYIRIKVISAGELTLIGWPQVTDTNLYRKVRLELYQPSNQNRLVTFAGEDEYVTIKYNDQQTFDPNGDGLEVSGDSIIVDAWVNSYDDQDVQTGLKIYLQYIGTFTEA